MKTGTEATTSSADRQFDELAEKNGLAIVLADEHSPAVYKANNNSMCEALYNSPEFAPHCDRYCGKAFARATEAGASVAYKCYAGLSCLAVPLEKTEKPLVAIVGRAFTKADDYRDATSRHIEGDWRRFPANDFFENILLANSDAALERLGQKLNASAARRQSAVGKTAKDSENQNSGAAPTVEKSAAEVEETIVDSQSAVGNPQTLWRSLFGSLRELSYGQACLLIVQFFADRYRLADLAWLERAGDGFETVYARGNLKTRRLKLSLAADDARLLDAARRGAPLELRERQTAAAPQAPPQTIRLFPISFGGEIQSALGVGDALLDGERERQIVRFCRGIAADLEILRLRAQLNRRAKLERAVVRFNENLKNIDAEDFWTEITNFSAELVASERGSLLVYDEKSDQFVAKAATGARADYIKNLSADLGERAARGVLESGAPLVVENVSETKFGRAPEEWRYRTDSFISYPIVIGSRRIGVLNLTDRAGGEAYGASDLEILSQIMPQLAVLIDRANLKKEAGEFEQLSVTDALTGLLNRRYLEERLTEEIKRSNRHGFPMSFLMIDVDEFKSYNDAYGHAEGDRALQIVGACLKETLRGADVAARYGGEEFSILLPQTNAEEAAVIAERVRERVADRCFPRRRVTISVGIASCSLSLNSAEDLISAADKALYEAKRAGRNNVQTYENLA